MKKCWICRESLPVEAFNRDKSRRGSLQSRCRACDRARAAAFLAANPHVRWSADYRKRVRRYGFEPVVEDFRLEDLVALRGSGCHGCGGPEWAELDHIVPVSLGGAHCLANVQLLCEECHRDKTRTDRAWIGEELAGLVPLPFEAPVRVPASGHARFRGSGGVVGPPKVCEAVTGAHGVPLFEWSGT